MTPARATALLVVMAAMAPGAAAAASVAQGAPVVPRTDGPVLRVQQHDLPDVVNLLLQRAIRAERRGDTETAEELFETLRALGFTVQVPAQRSTESVGASYPGASDSSGRDQNPDGDDGDDGGGDSGDGGGDGDG